MIRTVVRLFVFLCCALAFRPAYPEDIKSYSDCDICPGTLHYGPDEARTILGPEGLIGITRFNEVGRISLDLPWTEPPAKNTAAPAGLRVVLSGDSRILYFKDPEDQSYIQIVTDCHRAHQMSISGAWHPEIYLQSGHDSRIEQTDSLDVAWIKLKQSNIYAWVMADGSAVWQEALKARVVQALELLNK